MAGETLRTGAELLAGFPDNTTGLIEAVNSRDFVLSGVAAVGFMEDDGVTGLPFTIPITDGVPTDILSLIPAVDFVGNFWQLDGQQHFIPDYSGVTIPPGLSRLLQGDVLINVQKTGGGTADYIFSGTEGGVLTGTPVTRTIGITPTLLAFTGDRIYDVSVGGAISLDVEGSGTNDDLEVLDIRVSLTSTLI